MPGDDLQTLNVVTVGKFYIEPFKSVGMSLRLWAHGSLQ